MVGIISVVIGGYFGGGDHFDGGDHFGGGTWRRKISDVFSLTHGLRFCFIFNTPDRIFYIQVHPLSLCQERTEKVLIQSSNEK